MLEWGSKAFSCFLDISKAFVTVWIDGLLFQLFPELGIKGRMWLAIKCLFTNVKAKVLYAGSLAREIDISQSTGQGRILAPLMYKVYINSFLKVFLQSQSSLPSPSFADDISLPALYPLFLETFMNIYHKYGIKWRYEGNHTKSGVVTSGETRLLHSKWMLVDAIMHEPT